MDKFQTQPEPPVPHDDEYVNITWEVTFSAVSGQKTGWRDVEATNSTWAIAKAVHAWFGPFAEIDSNTHEVSIMGVAFGTITATERR